jgi:hypothetical protein
MKDCGRSRSRSAITARSRFRLLPTRRQSMRRVEWLDCRARSSVRTRCLVKGWTWAGGLCSVWSWTVGFPQREIS